MRCFLVAGLVVVLPALAVAETPAAVEAADGVLTYEMFEAAVPHADLAECPAGLARDDSFCRLTLAEGALTVWVFRNSGRQDMLALQSFDPEADGGLPF
jgi:hypothetical protein